MTDRAGPLSPARTRPRLTLAVVCAAIVLVPVTATGASVTLPAISDDLSTSLASAQWVVNAFFLTFAGFMAISGSLADLTGRRRMFAGGVALFCVAMLVAASAPGIAVLVTARVVAGIGAAAATTGGTSVLAQAFDGPARTRAFALFGTAIGLGLAFGPLAAGVLVTSLGGWRVFFLMAAVVLLPVLGLTPLLAESRDTHPEGVDWAGGGSFTGPGCGVSWCEREELLAGRACRSAVLPGVPLPSLELITSNRPSVCAFGPSVARRHSLSPQEGGSNLHSRDLRKHLCCQ